MHELDRRELAVEIGTLLSKDNIIAIMLKSPDGWDRIYPLSGEQSIKEEKNREMRRKD